MSAISTYDSVLCFNYWVSTGGTALACMNTQTSMWSEVLCGGSANVSTTGSSVPLIMHGLDIHHVLLFWT